MIEAEKHRLGAKLLESVSVDAAGCFNWTGNRNPDGYATTRMGVGQITKRASRLAYRVFRREIPEGMCVCHRCDNRACINPAHLYLGTNKQNSEDMAAKNRSCHGVAVNTAKMTPEKVLDLVARYNGGEKIGSLCDRFGISVPTLYRILNRQSWKRVLREPVALRMEKQLLAREKPCNES
jgi:hypothetical protein